MKLVIREYLHLLRESGELDELVPDLLLENNIEPIFRAQKGVRQNGVDIAAVGPDESDSGTTKLFLFVLKKGDVDRATWDTSEQAVRPTLNEILDLYFPNNIEDRHKNLPVKIVLCCAGDMMQNVQGNWKGYTDDHAVEGEIEFDFWGGDHLASLIETTFLDEHLFPLTARTQLRKTIAIVDQNETEPHQFYRLIHDTLNSDKFVDTKTPAGIRSRLRAVRLLNLAVNIVFHWGVDSNNHLPALLCAERLILKIWDRLRIGDLYDCKKTMEAFESVFRTYMKVNEAYAEKLQELCFTRDALFVQNGFDYEYQLKTFDILGAMAIHSIIISSFKVAIGLSQIEVEETHEEDTAETDPTEINGLNALAESIVSLIHNNPSTKTPLYDRHSIDISLVLLALHYATLEEHSIDWIAELVNRLILAYSLGHSFPVSSDRYDHLLSIKYGSIEKSSLMEISTILPLLAHWQVLYGMDDVYSRLTEACNTTLAEIDLQLWFPDEKTDENLYNSNATQKSGMTYASINLPAELSELSDEMDELKKFHPVYENLSCVKNGWPILALIASRHFKTPVLPSFWIMLNKQDNSESGNDTK